MTEEEKVDSLIDGFIQRTRSRRDRTSMSYHRAVKCAIILANEMIESFTNNCCESANSRYWNIILIKLKERESNTSQS